MSFLRQIRECVFLIAREFLEYPDDSFKTTLTHNHLWWYCSRTKKFLSFLFPDGIPIMPNHQKILNYLRQSRYLSDVPEIKLRGFISLIRHETYTEGATVIRQGELLNDVYFIIGGKVSAQTDGRTLYALGRIGDIFGEMGVVSSQPSQVTVVVLSDLEVLSISARSLDDIQQNNSHELSHIFYSWLSRVLADKLFLTSAKAKRFEDTSIELKDALNVQKHITHNLATLTADLKKSKAELEELNRLKNEFIGIASHDLRSPISSVIAVMETIPTCFELDAELVEMLSLVRVTCQEQLKLVNDLLDVALIESGNLELDCEGLSLKNLDAFLSLMVQKNAMLARSKRIRINFDVEDFYASKPENLDDNAELIRFDAPKIQQVMNNLLGNAIKFTPEGGYIRMEAILTGDQLRISVRDNGVGIAKAELPMLFDKLHRLKRSKPGTRGERGTGLGLVICKNLVDLHGGSIGVESQEDEGSNFWLSLPLLWFSHT
jgi:signal transduction histidine kinase